MSVFRKAMVYLGLVDDDEYYGDDAEYYADEYDDAVPAPRRASGPRAPRRLLPATSSEPSPVTVIRSRRERRPAPPAPPPPRRRPR